MTVDGDGEGELLSADLLCEESATDLGFEVPELTDGVSSAESGSSISLCPAALTAEMIARGAASPFDADQPTLLGRRLSPEPPPPRSIAA